jgi:hypothetical protein
LLPTRLPDVHVRHSLKMIGANLLGHRRSFSRSRHPARSQHVSHQLAAVALNRIREGLPQVSSFKRQRSLP